MLSCYTKQLVQQVTLLHLLLLVLLLLLLLLLGAQVSSWGLR
jgi:hypothetical protein